MHLEVGGREVFEAVMRAAGRSFVCHGIAKISYTNVCACAQHVAPFVTPSGVDVQGGCYGGAYREGCAEGSCSAGGCSAGGVQGVASRYSQLLHDNHWRMIATRLTLLLQVCVAFFVSFL